MRQRYVGVVCAQGLHGLSPQHGHFEHISLIDRTQTTTSLLCRLKGQSTDAANLRLAVAVGIVALADAIGVGGDATWLAEVNPAGQLSDNEHVQARHQLCS